jgi:hypothetical protein
MESIAELNKFTYIFQFLGLQNFPLDIINRPSISKLPSKFRLFVMFAWNFWALTFIISYFEIFVKDHYENQKNLLRFLNVVDSSVKFISVFLSTGFGLFKRRQIISFYQKAQEIIRIFHFELSHKVDFRQMKSRMMYTNLILDSTLFAFCGYKINGYVETNKLTLYQYFCLLVIRIYLYYILRFFNFYVNVVNFLMKNLSTMIKKELHITRLDLSAKSLYERRRIFVFRKIYFLIAEMTYIVNETLGLNIFLQILKMIDDLIFFGNEFYTPKTSVTLIYCELK